MKTKYLVVDDDAINNKLCTYIIESFFKTKEVQCFQDPEQALIFIKSEYNNADLSVPTILFLDINMPELTGWEFLEEFAKLSGHIHSQFEIYILSSSINPMDMERAKANIFVSDYLSKPLSFEKLSKL